MQATIGTNVALARQYLEAGELVAIPTETVYGLAANALNKAAVLKIFEAKQRPTFDPLIVHVSSLEQVKEYVTAVPEAFNHILKHFWPGPLTVLLPKKSLVPDLVTSGLDTVAIRIPNHHLILTLLKELDFPLAAPSANPFGYVSPTTALHVEKQLGNKVSYILDGGPSRVGVESTIIGINENKLMVYRLGGVALEELEDIVGQQVAVMPHSSSNPKAPGMLASHYAPGKPVQLLTGNQLPNNFDPEQDGVLSFSTNFGVPYQYILSAAGDEKEAAARLFTALRSFDDLPVRRVWATPVPDHGLGRAINDRLRRAAAK